MTTPPDPEQAPANLSPMETALLESLQRSSSEHEQRLTDLEKLLQQLLDRSKTAGISAKKAMEQLTDTLQRLMEKQDELEARLSALAAQLEPLPEQLRGESEAYSRMCEEYRALASEVKQLRELIAGLDAGDGRS